MAFAMLTSAEVLVTCPGLTSSWPGATPTVVDCSREMALLDAPQRPAPAQSSGVQTVPDQRCENRLLIAHVYI